jgi:hypothetical protein
MFIVEVLPHHNVNNLIKFDYIYIYPPTLINNHEPITPTN